jgi:hypothetical protein
VKKKPRYWEAMKVVRAAEQEFKRRQLADAREGRDVLGNGLLANAAVRMVNEIRAWRRSEQRMRERSK